MSVRECIAEFFVCVTNQTVYKKGSKRVQKFMECSETIS
jgi:hypothetical protein